jgi:hypothetical protein
VLAPRSATSPIRCTDAPEPLDPTDPLPTIDLADLPDPYETRELAGYVKRCIIMVDADTYEIYESCVMVKVTGTCTSGGSGCEADVPDPGALWIDETGQVHRDDSVLVVADLADESPAVLVNAGDHVVISVFAPEAESGEGWECAGGWCSLDYGLASEDDTVEGPRCTCTCKKVRKPIFIDVPNPPSV